MSTLCNIINETNKGGAADAGRSWEERVFEGYAGSMADPVSDRAGRGAACAMRWIAAGIHLPRPGAGYIRREPRGQRGRRKGY